jgi:DnaJ-class molecular chaperone
MSGRTHIDCFSTGLEDLKGARARDPIVVFDTIIGQAGVFSTFDVTEKLAKAVSFLFKEGYLKSTDELGYPWTKCTATEKGIAWRENRLQQCDNCGGKGYTLEMLNRRNAMIHKCGACKGVGFHISPAPTDQEDR